METFYPELAATNSPERFTGSWTISFRDRSGFDLIFLATDLVAATAIGNVWIASSEETVLHEPRPDAGALEELYAFDALPSLEALADAQGVQPIEDIDDLVADFWPEDESIEDFMATIRRWRDEEDTHLD